MKKFAIMLMVVVLLLSMAIGAHAVEVLDGNRKGILTLVMEKEGMKLDSGSLTVCRVGQIAQEGADWKFVLIPELQQSGLSLENLNDAQLANQLEQMVKEKALPGTTVQIRGGKAVFPDLSMGLYLVTQTEASTGFSPINAFLISLPRWENGRYVYHLTAQPKVSLEPLPTQPTQPTEPEPTKPTEPVLPQTGQLNWPVPVMAAAGLTLLALGWYLCRGKKHGHES